MKKLLISLLLLTFVVVISPKLIGNIVEEEHQSAVKKLNENPAITINSMAFNKGWFNGTAMTEMTILLQDDGIEDITILFEEKLSFGPIIFTEKGIELALGFSQATLNFKNFIIDEEVESFINDKIHLSGLLTFSKKIVSKIVIDEISKEIDGNKVAAAKAIGHFTLEDNNRLYGDFNWAGLTATRNNESFVIGNVQLSLDQTIISGDYYQGNAISIGDFDFSVASIEAKDTVTNKTFSLDNMFINAKSEVNSHDLMTITMNYSADKLESAEQKLTNANLAVMFNGLNINVMQEINKLTTGLQTNNEELFNPDNMEKFSLLTSKLLAHNPVIEIKNLSVQTPEGEIKSSMHLSVDNKLFDTANIMSIIPAIKADAKGNAPLPFFVNLGLAPMIDMYVEQGFIIQEEEELTFKVTFSQGQLNVNGNVIAL
jgi:uncharacterized protein YdgA (DUF945 family)